MTSNPVADFWAAHLSMPLGRHMTQTYASDIAPGPTYLRIAWDRGEDKDLLRQLAGKYVLFNEQRPDNMYEEKTLPDGSKIGGYDHGHFGFSVLSEIVQLWPSDALAKRAWNLMIKHGVAYAKQPNSYLTLASKTYGQTGRCRISAMCIRYLSDVRRAAEALGEAAYALVARGLHQAHISNVVSQPMHDGPQGDGLKSNHWRAFQVGIFAAALSDSGYINIPPFEAAIKASVARDPDGTPTSSFYYDVPEPITTPQPWTNLPGWKLGNGNGVELWLYRYLPADAKAVIEAANTKLPLAVRAKFGIPV